MGIHVDFVDMASADLPFQPRTKVRFVVNAGLAYLVDSPAAQKVENLTDDEC